MGEQADKITSPVPCAKWTDDCQGKKDYDGRLVSISTRYWPGSYRTDRRPSASSALVVNWGVPDEYGFGESTPWRETEFVAETEAGVKALVELWVQSQMTDLIGRLGVTLSCTSAPPVTARHSRHYQQCSCLDNHAECCDPLCTCHTHEEGL